MNRDPRRFEYDDWGPMYVGRIIRDPVTGELFDVIGVRRADECVSSEYLKATASEKSALNGSPITREMQRRDTPHPCPSRDRKPRHIVRATKPAKGAA